MCSKGLPRLQGDVRSVPRDDFSTKHQRNSPHDKYAIAVLPVDVKVAKIVGHLVVSRSSARLPWLKCSSEVLVYTNTLETAGEGGRHSDN